MMGLGRIGDRITATVTLERHFSFNMVATSIYVMKTDDGKVLEWRTTGFLGDWDKNDRNKWVAPEEGDRITIKGTIKGFSNGQTFLTRVKWVR